MARQFAVFDIDGTIVRTSLMQLLVKELVNRGQLDGPKAGDIERILHDGRQRIDDSVFGSYMKQAFDLMIQTAGSGLSLSDYTEAITAVANSLNSTSYVYTRQLIDTLKKNNFFLIAISGGEQRAVQAIASTLGFDACAAGVYYLDDGKILTGEVQKFEAKKDAVLQAIISKYDLNTNGSMAIGDTGNDTVMFNLVSQPIAFNPNQALFKIAREKNWMVVIERKDVVYGMQMENGQYVLKSVNV
jgi:HAD superfamily phosphoserine phosphatase-like hydrolase